jgi:hypothetical protein
MKKIVVLIDALHFKPGILDFAAYIASLGKSALSGVFVENEKIEAAPSMKSIGGQLYVEEITLTAEERKVHKNRVQINIEEFKKICFSKGIQAIAHYDTGNPLDDVVIETRYADLLIVDPSTSFGAEGEVPSKFITELLAKAECPVLVAPENFAGIDELVFAYNDSASSAFAIRQFYYQLPELSDRKVTVLHIKEDEGKDENINLFTEWLKMHYPAVSFVTLPGDPAETMFKYFLEHEWQSKLVLVTGAFGRTGLSSFFKRSTAELVLKTVDIPIFIAHH